MPITKRQFFTELQRCLGDKDDEFRIGRPFPLGLCDLISIQASAGHYCHPRETLSDVSQYTHVEVYTGDHPFLQGYLKEFNGGTDIVAAYVPVETLIEALNDYELFRSLEHSC